MPFHRLAGTNRQEVETALMFRTWMGIPLFGLHTLISQPTKVLGNAARGLWVPGLVIMKPGLPFQLVRHSGSPSKLLFLTSTRSW
jgi:hypothetical protein